jgi:hypothetical protein
MSVVAAVPASSFRQEEGSGSDWILLEEGELKGMNIIVDHESGNVLSLSTRFCRDEDRWTDMPELTQYPALQTLDLHNSRHIVQLNESIGTIASLKSLILTRCDALNGLPTSIGQLTSLQEVRRPHQFTFLARSL